MKILKNPVFTEEKKLPISIICVGVLALLLSFFNVTFNFAAEVSYVAVSFNKLASVISIFPLAWCLSTVLLMKTKKIFFAKLPAYVSCAMLVLAYILFFILKGQENVVTNLFLFMVLVLAVYPLIVATLTFEGRIYNRVFAVVFTAVLIVVCVASFIVISIYLKTVDTLLLVPTLLYVMLLLMVLSFKLEPLKKKNTNEPVNNNL